MTQRVLGLLLYIFALCNKCLQFYKDGVALELLTVYFYFYRFKNYDPL